MGWMQHLRKRSRGGFYTFGLTKLSFVPEVSCAEEKAGLVRENKILVRTLDLTAT